MRQKIQLELAFPADSKSEALRSEGKGPEACAARAEFKRQAAWSGPSMEAIVERDNLRKALAQVRRNKGAPGIDAMSVDDLAAYLKDHWPTIRAQLLEGTYRPQPVRRVEIPKEHSFAFRPGRSAHQAVVRAQAYIADGHRWVVDIDLEKFFDRVNHDLLMGLVAKRVSDRRILKLIRGFLTAGVLADGLVGPTDEGTPQGGPLSPLLSNLMLDVLDQELTRRGHRFVRYADDCNIYVRSQRAGERVMASVERFLAARLKLRINRTKSAVARSSERKFLGFSFTGGTQPKRRIAPQALARLKAKVRELTRRSKGASLARIVEDLSRYLTGWRGYFGLCETPSVLQRLDAWIRRRLRAIAWKQWKRGRTRFAELRRRGVKVHLAAQTAGSIHGPWRLSNSPALAIALPTAFLSRLGLVTLGPDRAAA